MDPRRRSMIAKVKIGQKALGWDDGFYRDVLDGRYGGRRSATKLSDRQLVDLLEHMKRCGFKPPPPSGPGRRPSREAAGRVAKIRALWISVYHLGAVDDRSERAMAAFVKRQAKVDAPVWLTAGQAFKVVEALKAMATRAGVDWRESDNPRICVVRALWRRLGALGVLRVTSMEGLDAWLQSAVGGLGGSELDAAIVRLGEWLRRQEAKREGGGS